MAGLARREDMMLVEEFLQFTGTRPDEEKWELFDGVPVMNAAAVRNHQAIVGNLIFSIRMAQTRMETSWLVIPCIGFRVSDYSLPVPDVMIVPPGDGKAYYCDDMIVAFEVLSPSTKKRDMNWKRKAYSSMASVQHYVIINTEKLELLHLRRADGWHETKLQAMSDMLEFPELSLGLKLSDVYFGLGY